MLTYSFNIDDAIDYGVNTAIVLNILNALILQGVAKQEVATTMKGQKEEEPAITISSIEMYALLPFLKRKEIDEAVQKAQEILIKKGLKTISKETVCYE